MRTRLPSSRGALRVRFSTLDIISASLAPILALFIRGAQILDTSDGLLTAVLYCSVWTLFSLACFQIFRLYDGLADHFSINDAFDIVKAVAFTELLTCLTFFTLSRLEGIPRSTPIIHALLLAASLISTRVLAQLIWDAGTFKSSRHQVSLENIIMIGATRLSSLYVKLIEASSPGLRRVIAVLDDDPKLIGRSMAGTRILAAPSHFQSVVEEFIVHGIHTDRVIVGSHVGSLSREVLDDIKLVCERYGIELAFVPQIIGLPELRDPTPERAAALVNPPGAIFALGPYLTMRRYFDPGAALVLIIILSPLLLTAGLLALLDVGSPAVFWQQRLGRGGRTFLLYKFRTLKAPFDLHGRPIRQRDQLSNIGRLLRKTRIDELPQLFNVLVGDMALIGPRPLLPEDQPENPATRLMARPGITGWAQVNGGKFLTPEEKDQYDAFYIRNASPWFDLRIVFMTLKVLLRVNGRSDHHVAAADRVGFGRQGPAFAKGSSASMHRMHHSSAIESPSLSVSAMSASLGQSSERTIQSADKLT